MTCKTNEYISSHPLKKRGEKWTKKLFLYEAKRIHRDTFDYSQIPSDISVKSIFSLKCNTCSYEWNTTITRHLQQKNCSNCSGRVRWTYKSFLWKAKKIHGNKFDYSEVKEEHIKGITSKIPLTCNICEYKWHPTLNDHINGKHGCPNCAGNVKWTYKRLMDRLKSMDRDFFFDYSNIQEDDVKNSNSHIPIICKRCGKKWSPTIDNHIQKGNCSKCNESKGEKYIRKCLVSKYKGKECFNTIEFNGFQNQLKFIVKHKFSCGVYNPEFDFYIKIGNKLIVIEYDGVQHFRKFGNFFHKNQGSFETQIIRDILKNKLCLKRSIYLLRISYKEINEIDEILEQFLGKISENKPFIHFSNKELYEGYLSIIYNNKLCIRYEKIYKDINDKKINICFNGNLFIIYPID